MKNFPRGGVPEELPPRARRIPATCLVTGGFVGTTSACAENTSRLLRGAAADRNYLRVRGEYRIKAERERKLAELPPRARRIHIRPRYRGGDVGTTSACAENTSS